MSRISPRVPFLAVLTAAALAASFGAGCDDDGTGPPLGTYLSPTSPENLLENLRLAYERREIEEYARILGTDFIFYFQPVDANYIGTDFWGHDQDSAGTRALFRSAEVSDIRLSLLHQPRDTTVNFPGTPLDTLRLFMNAVDLQVDQVEGITFLVADQQDMFFRRGLASAGEDATRWYLYAWRDMPTFGAPGGLVPASGGASSPVPVSRMTWGKMKLRYSD